MMNNRLVLLIVLFLPINIAAQERTINVFDMSSNTIEYKTNKDNKWNRIIRGITLSQEDSLRFQSNSWIKLEISGNVYEYTNENRKQDKSKETCICVYDLVIRLRDRANKTILEKAYQELSSNGNINRCSDRYNVNGVGYMMGAKRLYEQDFASFIKSSDKKHLNKNVYMRMHRINKTMFRIEVINNSDYKYYFNIIRVNRSGKIQICLDYCDENSEVSFYINPKSRIPENSINATFVNDGDYRYYLVGSRKKFSWRMLENELNQTNNATEIGDSSIYIISKAR